MRTVSYKTLKSSENDFGVSSTKKVMPFKKDKFPPVAMSYVNRSSSYRMMFGRVEVRGYDP